MSGLLVSVRSADEAALALAAGADVIDVKEPQAGSLGAASADTIEAVCKLVAGRVPVSVALGELLDVPQQGLSVPAGVAYAKLGLAACSRLTDWETRWSHQLASLPAATEAVAVVYADPPAAAPLAAAVIDAAGRMGCAAVLVDTWDKTSGSLTAHWPVERIGAFIDEVQRRGMRAVLAGGLTADDVATLAALRPDLIAVRGAACQQGRTGFLDRARVQRLKEILVTAAAAGPKTVKSLARI